MNRYGWIVIALAVVAACKGKDERYYEERDRAQAGASAPASAPPEPEEDESGGTGAAMALEEGKMGKKDAERAAGQYKMKGSGAGAGFGFGRSGYGPGGGGSGEGVLGGEPADDAPAAGKNQANVPEGPTRAWFPETFLFEPRVVTDDQGRATVPVRVPDRLTTWRVLALAHSRGGSQGGAVTSFLGTLPTYVDLVVPETLTKGDDVRLPIQIVNTTESPVSTALELTARNATVSVGGGTRTVPAAGSVVEYARLRADRVGTVELRVALRGGDALVRTIEVLPTGRPETTTRTGTLAAPRTLTIEAPAGSDPSTDRVRLLAFPGALALLRSELGVCTARAGRDDDAYALLLGGKAPELLTALGDQADPDALRGLAIVATQRAIRHARTLDVETATLLVEPALAHPLNPVLARLGERAAAYLAQQQRPDGTFAGGQGWTLQQVLVATADATRAVGAAAGTSAGRQRAIGVAIAASGAFERNFGHIEDGYTAAAVLASGAVKGPQADLLRTRVKDAIKASPDGNKYLEVAAGVVRADGARPTTIEATALAVLALAGDPQAPLADLGATLLGAYAPGPGWGDGRTNLVSMRAVLELFKDPVPPDVKITLTMDGQPVVTGTLDRARLREVLALTAPAPGLAGSHTWQITAEPAVPGLGFSLTLESWVPWGAASGEGGLELALPAAVSAAVGKPTELAVRAIAPSGMDLHLELGLPAGVQVDRAALDALVKADTIASFTVSPGKLALEVDALDPGQTFAATVRVIPTLAGTLRSPPSLIAAGTTALDVPPSTWTVK